VHGGCGGVKGSMYGVMEAFVCGGCMIPVTGAGCMGVDVGVGVGLELVDRFCY